MYSNLPYCAGYDIGQSRIREGAEAALWFSAAQGGGSGVDVVASTFGGFQRFERKNHAQRRALEKPAGLAIRLVWTGQAARTSDLVAKVREQDGPFGYNADTDVYEDLVKAGVIDPTKVVRSALQNAASVAALLLTTEATVAEAPEKEGAGGGGMPGGMPGGGMPGMM